MEKEIEKNWGLNLKIILCGTLISVFITFICIFILSLILSYTNTSEKIVEGGIIFISAFSILIGTFWCLRKIKEKGIVYGGVLGIIYMLIIYLISSIVTNNFSLGLSSIAMILLGIISGIIGGILGVNIKN